MGSDRRGYPLQAEAQVRLERGPDRVSLMKQLGLTEPELYRAWTAYLRCCEKGGADDMKAVVRMMRDAPELTRGVTEYFAILGLNLFFDCLRDAEKEGS